MIKTFRGLLGDGAQERIRLQTLDGKQGYRIKTFQLIGHEPGLFDEETVMKIFSIEQTAIDAVINFSEQTLLAASFWQVGTAPTKTAASTIVFDQVTFNQDIFITSKDISASRSCNYYLELETISLDDVEATAVILKNFRNTNTVA